MMISSNFKLFPALALLFVSLSLPAQEKAPAEYQQRYAEVMKRTAWWREARFGMFIHFGAYAVPARGEWVKSNERLTTAQYQAYVDAFNPQDYDPKQWARLAKQAGMKYAVMTAKHHDGFCLFDSKLTDYDINSRMPGRDLVREFLDAFRAEGLRVGLYYSLIDWHHADYPNVGNHPQRGDAEYAKRKFNWDNYLRYMHGQVEELLTGYGKLDIMWFDYSFEEYQGEKWKASELVALARRHQPDMLLDSRLTVSPGVVTSGRLLDKYGDFETPEQGVPDEGLVDRYGNPLPWETCLTLNNNWGYHATDQHWKSPEMVVQTLVDCVSKNGNLLLNVGPDAKGRIPEPSVRSLEAVGKWMDRNKESIYGCSAAGMAPPRWGRYTQKGNTLYVHWMYPQVSHINVPEVAGKVERATMLFDGTEAATASTWWGNEEKGNFFLNVAQPTYMTFSRPDPWDTVFKLILKP